MKSIVVYQSETGCTEKYAQDIASKIGTEAVPLKKFKWKTLKEYDCLIFGGWIANGIIQGLNDFLAHYDDMEGKNVLIFSSGLSVPTPEGRNTIINANILDLYHVRYYQLRGSFDFSKLNWKNKMLMKLALNKILKDPNTPPETVAAYSMLETQKVDYYDYEKIEKIVNVVKKIEAEPIEVKVQ